MTLTDQAPIFISYGRDDETADFVPRLHDDLESNGVNAWLDKKDIPVGQDWDLAIQQGLDACRALLLIVTQKSLQSPVVRAEWNRVLNAGKPVVPLMWGKDVTFEALPFRLQLRQGIDFHEDYYKGRAQLFQFLRDLPATVTPADLARAKLDELKQAQARSDDPQQFAESIQDTQKRLAYEERRAENPQAVQQEEQASVQASIERVQQQQIRQAEQRQSVQRVVGRAPQDVKNKFKDRTHERATLKTWFAHPDMPLMVVVGHGGMGKTALTCYVMDELENDYEQVAGLIYLSTTTGRVDLEQVFLTVGQMIGHPLIEAYNDAQKSLAERIQKLLDALHREDAKRYLLLLDNFETLQHSEDGTLHNAELQEFLHLLLRQRHACKILVTTRTPLKIPVDVQLRAQHIRLEMGLPREEAVQFLRELAVKGTDAQLGELADKLHGYPRALEAAAGYLQQDPFLNIGHLLAREDIFHIPSGSDDKLLIENMVRAALISLEAEALRVMQALAVYNRPVPEVAVETVLDPFQPVTVTRDQLKTLTRRHLITYDNGLFSLHPVDQAFAYNALPVGGSTGLKASVDVSYTRIGLHTRASDYFKTTRLAREKWKSIKDLEPQLAEFEQRMQAQDYDTAARIMDEISFDYLMLWGHLQKVLELREQLLGKLQDSGLERRNYGYLGVVYGHLGMTYKSISYYEKALQNSRDNHEKSAEGAWLGNLGNAYSDLGEVRQAIDYHEQALVISREIGDRRGEGIRLGNLGNAYSDLGEVRKAIGYYEQALGIDREIGNKQGESIRLDNLGHAYLAEGKLTGAIAHYQQALTIGEEIGFHLIQHYARIDLAKGRLLENNLAAADDLLRQAQQFDRPDNNHVVFAVLGIVCLRRGNASEARSAFEQSLRQADDLIGKTPEYWGAWYAKGLALAGLACIPHPQPLPTSGEGSVLEASQAAYQRARDIFAGAGVIQAQLMLLDELRKADGVGVRLDAVRAVLAGG